MTVKLFIRPDFKDRSGKRLLFADAVVKIGTDKFGSGWSVPVSCSKPMIITESKSKASDDQLIYAVAILRSENPDLEVEEVKEDYDENVGGIYIGLNLNISEQQWAHALSFSKENYDRQAQLYREMLEVLNIFAASAAQGEIKCYARQAHLSIDREIPSYLWEVSDETLLDRLSSGLIQLSDEGKLPHEVMIIVDSDFLKSLPQDVPIDYRKREEIVRENLRRAKAISDVYVPHGKIAVLRSKIRNHLLCDKQKVDKIIRDETGGCWSKQGVRKISETKINQIKIVP